MRQTSTELWIRPLLRLVGPELDPVPDSASTAGSTSTLTPPPSPRWDLYLSNSSKYKIRPVIYVRFYFDIFKGIFRLLPVEDRNQQTQQNASMFFHIGPICPNSVKISANQSTSVQIGSNRSQTQINEVSGAKSSGWAPVGINLKENDIFDAPWTFPRISPAFPRKVPRTCRGPQARKVVLEGPPDLIFRPAAGEGEHE